MKHLFSVIITLFIINSGFSQNIDTNKLNTYFNTLESNNKFMGSVAIYSDSKVYYNKQYGFSEIAAQIEPSKNTKYRIGSISKTITAALVFKAIERKKISLTETVDSYFPTIKNASKITIENLLNHRSGIHSFTDEKKTYLSYNTQAKTKKEMVDIISNYDSDFEPNTQAAYSNSNYLLLSYILEEKYDKTFAQILKEEVCIPLKLEHTYFAEEMTIKNNEALSYRFEKQWKKVPQTNGSIGLGAGSILSTPTDLIAFSNALFSGKIIALEHLKKMQEIKDGYGMGLFQTKYFDFMSYGHNGGIDGFVSMFRYFPKEGIAFAVIANGLAYDFNAVETVIVKSIFNKHYDIPVFTTYTPTPKELQQYLGSYSSSTFPVKINVIKQKKQLVLKVSGQEEMPLEAFDQGKFKFEKAGIRIAFVPNKNEMLITQGGKTNTLKKE